ncbi:MAG: efflux RND transporter periplasmic adaptor subunit [Deltaproteobacteria bacterium]|nr:efflux RND transporter periplasmic adaptor subunit [Deltaproteobacteria bacterium]
MANNNLDKLKINTAIFRQKFSKKMKMAIVVGVLAALGLLVTVINFYSAHSTYKTETTGYYNPSRDLSILVASGYVVAQKKAAVASKITGRVKDIFVEEGSFVRTGQVLAVLDDEEARANYDQAASSLKALEAQSQQALATLNNSLAEYERGKYLLAEGHISKSQYDIVSTRFFNSQHAYNASLANAKVGEAVLALAQVGLTNTRITAPFDAVVLTKNADIGDVVTPLSASVNTRSSVFTIANMASLQIEADVSETSIAKVFPGQHCEIQIDAIQGDRFAGRVSAIVPTVERAKATVLVKVEFAKLDRRLLQDMSAKIAFLSRKPTEKEQKQVLVINNASLLLTDEGSFVFVVDATKSVTKTKVATGNSFGNMVEILTGIKFGDEIVISPTASLKDGKRITIAGE